MRRLIQAEADRGAIAIMVALLVPVLLVVAALAVDMSASFAKHSQLQNGADAAALALAQTYAASTTGCVEDSSLANDYVRGSVNRDKSEAKGVPECFTDDSGLTVVATAKEHHYFLPLLGRESSPIEASATVEWGRPVAGFGFPLTFSDCVFESSGAQAGDYIEVWVPQETGNTGSGNPCQDRDYPPGGFGWLKSDDCLADYADIRDGWVEIPGETGNDDKTGCDWDNIIGTTVLIPIFSDTNGVSGNGQAFRIDKFASFELLGVQIHTGSRHGFTSSTQCKHSPSWGKWKKHCVYGRFVEYTSIDEAFEIGPVGPSDDTLVVRLTD